MERNLSDKTDEEISALVQSGKIEAFEILINRYEVKMSRYARKFLSSSDDINDVLQDIFIKVYINIQSFDVKRKFSSWLYRIAHNELVNVLKKRKKVLPLFDLDVFLPHSLHDNELSDKIDQKDMRTMIDKCLEQLEAKYREPIILYYLEGLGYKEIAEIMQIPVSTVGIRVKRAKKMMKIILTKLNYTL